MLLTALKAYHERRPDSLPPLYVNAPVRYIIDLDRDGRMITGRVTDLADPADPKAKRGQVMPLPQVVRSSGVKPLLLADKADYVLGFSPDESKSERVAACHQAFVDLVGQCAAATGSRDVTAIHRFVSGGAPRSVSLPHDFDPGATITMAVEGRLPINDADVRAFWAGIHDPGAAGAPILQCVVCGKERPVVKRLPGKVKGIPGGQTAGTSLISANSSAFESYGLEASLVSPICSPCAESVTRALNTLLADSASRVRIDPAVFTFWTREPSTLDFFSTVVSGDPEAVRALLAAVQRGGHPAAVEANLFYGLTLSASGGRAVVRDWIDMSVDQVVMHATNWFERQRIVDPWSDTQRPLGLFALAASTARDAKDVSPWVVPSLLRGALTNAPLPLALMDLAVRRCRAEQGVIRSRAALVKLVLLSHTRERGDVMVGLDEDNPSVAYQCGRLLAVLESAQRAALGDVGAGIVDRFYGSASSAPITAFPGLLRGVQPHLGKLQRDRPAVWQAIHSRIGAVLDHVSAFPATLTLQEQGMFALGFYHQRSADRERMKEAADRKAQAATPVSADTDA
jgi:CRISPR-associated protein Csd1